MPPDGASLVIGRSGEADVAVTIAQASRRHAELRSTNGTISCHDVGSSYGTWIERNGHRFDVPAELITGDRIVTAGDVVVLTVIEVS